MSDELTKADQAPSLAPLRVRVGRVAWPPLRELMRAGFALVALAVSLALAAVLFVVAAPLACLLCLMFAIDVWSDLGRKP
jgi:hypothetical protein